MLQEKMWDRQIVRKKSKLKDEKRMENKITELQETQIGCTEKGKKKKERMTD